MGIVEYLFADVVFSQFIRPSVISYF